MPSLVSGNSSSTAAASRCAVEWRYTSSASGFFDVRICRLASPSRAGEVVQLAVDACDNGVVSQSRADRFGDVEWVVPAATCCVDSVRTE